MAEAFQLALGTVIMAVGVLAIVFYPKLQYQAIRNLRGSWRACGFLPLVLMVPVLAVTGFMFAQDANLWPIVLIFAAPVASLYLGALFLVHRYVAGRRALDSE